MPQLGFPRPSSNHQAREDESDQTPVTALNGHHLHYCLLVVQAKEPTYRRRLSPDKSAPKPRRFVPDTGAPS